jgi:hypothetical protein
VGGKGSTKRNGFIHAIAAGDLECALYIVSLLVSVLLEELLLIQRRGFGRRGFGFGRRRGSFGLFRILFALLLTTLLGSIGGIVKSCGLSSLVTRRPSPGFSQPTLHSQTSLRP